MGQTRNLNVETWPGHVSYADAETRQCRVSTARLLSKIASTTLLFCSCIISTLCAQTIAGTVHNQTTKAPAAGDEVVLLRLGNGMEEEGRTKTDAQGAFTLTGKTVKAQYVLRVLHQGVNYDQTVIGTGPLEINVFDAVPRLNGLSGSIGMAQMESDGKTLNVTEMYAIINASNPPVTQAGERNFEFSLPENAIFDAAQVRRAEGTVWVNTPPVPAPGRPHHYALNFPIRPGATLFKFSYHLPYSAHTRFNMRLPYPIQKFAVMHPPSISFKALQKGAFLDAGSANGLRVEKVAREPSVEVPPFEVSGAGFVSAPPAIAQGSPAPQVITPQVVTPQFSAPQAPTKNVPAGSGGGHAEPAKASPAKTLWISVALLAGIVAIAVLAAWQIRRSRVSRSTTVGRKQPLVEVLKEELFQLELERAQGSISAEDYATTKQALGHSLQRAMAKAAGDS
jgi:hypothetical protein